MRATWPGARSARISITTSPWVVSRISVLSPASLMGLGSFLVSAVYERKGERTARRGVAEARRALQRRAGVDGGDRGTLVERAGLGRRLAGREGEARLAEQRTRASE